MNNVLFVLIDAGVVQNSMYSDLMYQIHNDLIKKLSCFDICVVGSKQSIIAEHKFSDIRSLYDFVKEYASGRDIIVIDAFAKMLSLEDVGRMLEYIRTYLYDVCFSDHLPDGILPSIISGDFIEEFVSLLDRNNSITSSIKNLIQWEYQGIDVGVYLSYSKIGMKRIEFLPVNKGSIEWLSEFTDFENVSLENMEHYIKTTPKMLRNYPEYVAFDITSPKYPFFKHHIENPTEMSVETFDRCISEISELAPETLISLGVWGDPFEHSQFANIFLKMANHSQRVLVETRALSLNKEYAELVLSRPNTELIIDISCVFDPLFSDSTKTIPSQFVYDFILNLPNPERIWIRLTRTHSTEPFIQSFIKEWQNFLPRVLITKADSFGDPASKVVDLAPLQRHGCYALRRELTIKNDGSVLLCRQTPQKSIGSIQTNTLKELWNKNNNAFFDQENGNFNTCEVCKGCDDWWIWN
ncbi:MAG: SPASM domain-containing protein [Brevinemataceae bacterium]